MTSHREAWQDLAEDLRKDMADLANAVYQASGQIADERDVCGVAAGLAVRCRLFSDTFERKVKQAGAKAKGKAS